VDPYFKYLWIGLVGIFIFLPMLGVWMREPGQVEQEQADIISDVLRNDVTVSNAQDEEMLTIPAGQFLQGSSEGAYHEKPEAVVFLDTFTIDKYEVSNRRYADFVEWSGHRAPVSRYGGMAAFQRPNFPVVYVSWDDAVAFCTWDGKRLPTEAEWEKAARGVQGSMWPWGDSAQIGLANVKGQDDGVKYTAQVGAFEGDRSVYGVADMAGNVREWVNDWYDQHAYRLRAGEKGIEPEARTTRVLRGGSWTDSLASARTTARFKMLPRYRDTAIGFRCVRSGAREKSTQNGEKGAS
tara:strand:+ start:208 stop:1092 length:885 start_codon:yes stop_codon:yes gene_type:complete